MSIREFKLFNESETAYIAEQVNIVVRKWSEKWFNDHDLVETEIIKPGELNERLSIQPMSWYLGQYDKNVFASHFSNEFLESIYRHIVASSKSDDIDLSVDSYIGRKLVNINVCSLIDDICKSFYSQKNTIRSSQMTTQEFLDQANRYGSGYIFIKLGLKNHEFMLVAIELSSLQKSVNSNNNDAEKEELYPAINAFGNHTVKMEVIVGTSVINISSLTNMAVGDVLTIDSGENSDVDLNIDNKKVCAGIVGRVGSNFAVKINGN